MFRDYKKICIVIVLGLLYAAQLQAASFKGEIVEVVDADVVKVLSDGLLETVRLAQIYAPLNDQPYGKFAKFYVTNIALGKTVSVRVESMDHYGRMVGEVFSMDGSNLNKLIVKAGYAWQYKGYSSDSEYAVLEAAAREANSGLWQSSNPVPPWEWRWVQNKLNELGESFNCSDKQYCHEMTDCNEAKLYLYACGKRNLKKESDSVVCPAKCE